MKYLYCSVVFLLGMLYSGGLQAQASHTPQNKNFLIEKGTGHVCGSCPGIALKCDTVIDSHPGRGMLIEYHFGPDAVPQAGSLTHDFRTWYGDTIYEPTKLNWPFYLNMMVNRRDQGPPYGSTFIFGPNNNQVQPESDLVVNQASPVNLYMAPSYNPSTRLLTVNTELYYTANAATDSNYIQIAITEDSIILTQYDPVHYTANSGFNPKFNHTNVFRDNINGFGGDLVKTTTAGSTVSRTYKYTMPTSYKNIACDPKHCRLTMYVADKKNRTGIQKFTGKIITAIRTDFNGKSLSVSIPVERKSNFTVYPNPSSGIVRINIKEQGNYTVEVCDMQGRTVYTNAPFFGDFTNIDLSSLPKGVYFVKLKSKTGITTQKLILSE